MLIKVACLSVVFLILSFTAEANELSGRVGYEARYFSNDDELQNSIFVEPELYWSASRDDSFTLKIFARYDELDDERSHLDVREAIWLRVGDSWELRAGIGKVFWGVTESNHLVDVINQTDAVESADGEQKLGQPMIQYSSIKNWGVLDFFVLPGFRERTFPGDDGRLTGPFVVDTNNARYESNAEDSHIDYALRYSHSVNVFDFGLSLFSGTNRDPKFLADAISQPYYDQMHQLGIDVQATMGDWLFKIEGIYRDDSLEGYFSETAGFEYTFVNIADTGIDLGVLSEYSYDSRENSVALLDNDIFVGARITFNDVQSTDLLFGVTQDLEKSSSQLAFIEGSRRIGNSWKITIDAREFSSNDESDPIFFIDSEDYASMTLEWYY